jgi:hypothetical protein
MNVVEQLFLLQRLHKSGAIPKATQQSGNVVFFALQNVA